MKYDRVSYLIFSLTHRFVLIVYFCSLLKISSMSNRKLIPELTCMVKVTDILKKNPGPK